jgi:hypothetical protein
MGKYNDCRMNMPSEGEVYGYCGLGSARIAEKDVKRSGYLQELKSAGILPDRYPCIGPSCKNPTNPKTVINKRKHEILGAPPLCASPIYAFLSSKIKSSPEK